MNKLWDEAELKWIKTLSNSPKSSGHATQLSISFRNKANILIWCGFVQLPQNLLCRNKTNWTEKVLEEKPHKRTQNASGVAKLLQVLWRRQPRQLGRKASLPVTPASSQMEKCVCVPIHSCVNVSHFRKNTFHDLNASVLNVFPVRVVKGEATSAASRNNYRNNAPHWDSTSHLSATRWRIITEFVFHTSVDQCLCAILLNSKMCIHLFNNVLHTSYIRQRRMFTACSEKGLLLFFLTCHRTCTVDRTSLTGNNFPLVNISTEIFNI